MSEEAVVQQGPQPVESQVAAGVSATVDPTVPSGHSAATPANVEAKPAPTAEELQKKFDRDAAMQRRKYERQLQAEREERIRLEERLSAVNPKIDTQEQIPTIDKFDNIDDYVDAKAERKFKQMLFQLKKQQQEAEQRTMLEQLAVSWNKKIAAADLPDFHEVTEGLERRITPAMQQAIVESDNGPKLAYHLATHPEDAERIARMTPIGAVRALTLIEEGLTKPVAVSQATPPIKPVGSKSTSIKSLLDVKDYDEFTKRRAAQIAKRR